MFDDIRNQFAFYRNNKDIVYLDYAATTFMPDSVIAAWEKYNCLVGTSINRGNGVLADQAQQVFEDSKTNVVKFFHANNYEMIIGKNATECLNVIANIIGERLLPGDIVLMGPYEHHSNLLPWELIAERKGATLVQLPLLENGEIDYSFINKLEMDSIRIIAFSLVSNINSYSFDIDIFKRILKKTKAYSILDVSQAAGHKTLDFDNIGADVYVAPAHKMYGPKSVGAAFVKKELIEKLPPFLVGGGMVWNSMGGSMQWQVAAKKYEAGTMDVSNMVAWSAACNFLSDIGMGNVEKKDRELAEQMLSYLDNEERIKVIPYKGKNLSMISFSVVDIHSHDISDVMKDNKIELRVGHLCAQNTLSMFGEESVCRVSWGLGTNEDDLNVFYKTLRECIYG